jgi:hypothetical protein
LQQFYKTLTGAERKIGGKKVAFRQALVPKNTGQEGGFLAGQHGRPASKRSLREGISAEKHRF